MLQNMASLKNIPINQITHIIRQRNNSLDNEIHVVCYAQNYEGVIKSLMNVFQQISN